MEICRLPVKNGMVQYSRTEEKIHVISHAIGIILGFAMIPATIYCCGSRIGLIGGLVYAVSLIVLYSASCLYHGVPAEHTMLKDALRVFDHCSIFVLIAGSGTPFILCTISSFSIPAASVFNLIMWGCAVFGTVLLIINLKKFKGISILLYLIMGFSVLSQNAGLRSALGTAGYALLLAGGIIYCIGLIFYSIKVQWAHTIFHVLCIVASFLHCICVCLFVI